MKLHILTEDIKWEVIIILNGRDTFYIPPYVLHGVICKKKWRDNT